MADIDVATAQKIVVVTTTYYPDAEDVRFALALELCRLARRRRVRLVLVDGSPRHDAVREALERAGTAEYAHVVRQDADDFPGKGGALRQAIRHATALLRAGDAADDAVICFAEPEKVNLMNHVAAVAKPIFDGSADVVVPRRSEELFRQTYPIEQYHSESFGNRHFDLLARQHAKQPAGGALDWLFGPVAFKAGLAEGWLGYGGTSWDAQMIPYVRGMRQRDWKIASVTVDYHHPAAMKEQEEGDPAWTKKRLHQLNLLFDLLGKELS